MGWPNSVHVMGGSIWRGGEMEWLLMWANAHNPFQMRLVLNLLF